MTSLRHHARQYDRPQIPMASCNASIQQVSTCESLSTQSIDRLRQIYIEAFPPEERRSHPELSRRISDRRCFLYLALADREPVGFAIWAALPRTGATVLEYLAVGRPHRGRGVGTLLLTRVVNAVRGESQGIVLEVDPLDPSLGEKCNSDRARRMAFYYRHAAQVIDGAPHYIMPNLSGGDPLPMTLLWIPTGGQPQPKGDMLGKLIIDLLCVNYDLSLSHEIVTQNLARLCA